MNIIDTGVIRGGCGDGFEVFYPVPADVTEGSTNEAW
jgi:hypothetical protein